MIFSRFLQIIDALSFMCSKDARYRNKILLEFAKIVNAEGMKLLSQAQDMEFVADYFLTFIEIFNSLISYRNRDAEPEQQRLNPAAAILRSPSVSGTFFDVPPDNLKAIQTEIDMLWKAMEEWLTVLQKEINQFEEQVYCSEQKEHSNSASFQSSIRSSKFLRSVSKTSINLEQLRLSQPAYAVNQRDTDGSTSSYLTRSQSYTNALSEISDDFEKTLSSEKIDNTSPTVPHKSLVFDEKLIDFTADRLCAAIHGYHLYCLVQPTWEKTYRMFDDFLYFLEMYFLG